MKKVIIKCISNYSLVNKCRIIIFDKCNNQIYDNYTHYGKIELFLNKGLYKAIIISFDINSSILLTNFIVNNDINCFNCFFSSNKNLLKITTTLVDKNYFNLPIERGKIKLWQDHIQ